MKLLFKKDFEKSYKKYKINQQKKIDERIFIFKKDPFDSQLRNHGLKGKRYGFRSIDAGGDLRIIFNELSNGSYEIVEIVNIGTHSDLY